MENYEIHVRGNDIVSSQSESTSCRRILLPRRWLDCLLHVEYGLP